MMAAIQAVWVGREQLQPSKDTTAGKLHDVCPLK